MKVTVIKYSDIINICNDELEESVQYNYLFSYDVELLVREIVEVMQYRASASINLLFETSVYIDLLKHVQSFIASKEVCIEHSRSLVYKLTETIDKYIESIVGTVVRIDTVELTIEDSVFCIYLKEDLEKGDEETMFSRPRRRISSSAFSG